MNESDMEKTSFVVDKGTYCYKIMPFRLKNVGVTYQRLLSWIFKENIGKIMKVCIDDMVVKSKKTTDHLKYLVESLDLICKYRMKLNLEKCDFGIPIQIKAIVVM